MTNRAVFTSAVLVLVAAGAQAAAPAMSEGLWELAVKAETPNVPAGSVQGHTVQRCMSAKDFSDPRKTAPDSKAGSQCEVSNYRTQANTATWEISCKGPEQMKGTGTMTFEGQRYNGAQKMTMKQDGQTVPVTMNYAGRYLGPCKSRQK